MRALLALVQKDLKLMWRGHMLLIAFVTVAFSVGAGRFLRGKELPLTEAIYLVDQSGVPGLRERLAAEMVSHGATPVVWDGSLSTFANQSDKHFAFLPDEATLRQALSQADLGFGAIIEQRGGSVAVRYLMPDLLDEASARLMSQEWQQSIDRAALRGDGREPVPVITVGHGQAVPLGHTFVPLFILGEAFIVAVWLGAIFIFSERSERTVFAVDATPARVRGLLLAKLLSVGLVVVVEVVLTIVGVWGYHPGMWTSLLAALLLYAGAMGVVFFFGASFESLTSFTLVGALLSVVAGLPMLSFFSSSFPDLWWLPTYSAFRALRESFFPSGRSELLLTSLGTSALWAALFLSAGLVRYRRRLRQA